MADLTDIREKAKYTLSKGLLNELEYGYGSPEFIAMHGSRVWGNKDPDDIDILYIVDNPETGFIGRQNRKFGIHDVTIMTKRAFLFYIGKRDIQFIIFMWLPSEYVLFETPEFRDILSMEESALVMESKPCKSLMLKTNIQEIKYSWAKAQRLFECQSFDKSMKCIFCSFRRAILTQHVLQYGVISNMQVANSWWTIICEIFSDKYSWLCSLSFDIYIFFYRIFYFSKSNRRS